jgi:protein-disulfide isomerase
MNPNLILRPDGATDHVLGPFSAKVVLVEYGDFECPSCGQAHSATKMMLKRVGRDVKFVFRHFPQVEVHPHAELAAEAAEAAGAQGRFWPYFDLLFEHQQHLGASQLTQHAENLGLDLERFEYELNDHVYLQRVQEHLAGGRSLGVRATPAFYVDGTFVDVSFGIQHLHDAVDAAIKSAR